MLTATGCGSSARPVAGLPVAGLPARAVPGLPSTLTPLTPAFLARETQVPPLRARLRAWGFIAGARRYFQGESRTLQLVDSRTLRFRGAVGAAAFVEFLRAHLAPYVGSFAHTRRFTAQGRRGFLAVGQECQCHLANPTYLAAVSARGTVTWLEINGPAATRGRLAALLARAP
ncbi:MAG: hypothetical protein ACJ780_08075 [Solirubrobacteraceae bacterium]